MLNNCVAWQKCQKNCEWKINPLSEFVAFLVLIELLVYVCWNIHDEIFE